MAEDEELRIIHRADSATVILLTVAASYYVAVGLIGSQIFAHDLPGWRVVWIVGGLLVILRCTLSFPSSILAYPMIGEPRTRKRICLLVLMGMAFGMLVAIIYPIVGWLMWETAIDDTEALFRKAEPLPEPKPPKMVVFIDKG